MKKILYVFLNFGMKNFSMQLDSEFSFFSELKRHSSLVVDCFYHIEQSYSH